MDTQTFPALDPADLRAEMRDCARRLKLCRVEIRLAVEEGNKREEFHLRGIRNETRWQWRLLRMELRDALKASKPLRVLPVTLAMCASLACATVRQGAAEIVAADLKARPLTLEPASHEMHPPERAR